MVKYPRKTLIRAPYQVRRDTIIISYLLLIYLIFCIYFFYRWVNPAMLGIIDFRPGADSFTYIDTARFYGEISQISFKEVIKLSSNLFGPVFIILITNYNYFYIFLFNSVLLLISLRILFTHYSFNRLYFILLFIANPITLSSITTVNKEITGLCGIIFLLVYMKSNKMSYLVIALLLSFFTRWQQFLFVIVLLPYLSLTLKNTYSRYGIPMASLIFLSILYPSLSPFLDFTGDTRFDYVQSQFSSAGGLLNIINNLQENYLYMIVFPIKALLNYIGNLPRIVTIFNYDPTVDYYNRIVVGHQLMMFFVIVISIFRRTINIRDVKVNMIFLYSLLYCIALTINYRYFYPIFPLFILIAIADR